MTLYDQLMDEMHEDLCNLRGMLEERCRGRSRPVLYIAGSRDSIEVDVMTIEMEDLMEEAHIGVIVRRAHFENHSPGEWRARLSGYILAMFDVGLISKHSRDLYAEKFDLDLFPDIR